MMVLGYSPLFTVSLLNLLDGPAGVLRNQGFGICRGFPQSGQGGGISDVAEGHTHVAQQPAAFDAPDRRFGKAIPSAEGSVPAIVENECYGPNN